MSLAEIRNVAVIMLLGGLALYALDYASWQPWPQLIGGSIVALLATLAAPTVFGWRDDEVVP